MLTVLRFIEMIMVELMGLQQAQWMGLKSSNSSMRGLVMPSIQIRTYLARGRGV